MSFLKLSQWFIFLSILTMLNINCQISNQDKVNLVRERVLRHYAKTLYNDIESVKNSHWLFERYLHDYNYKERDAEKAIIEAFDYFHRERLHELDDTFFPSEAYAVGALYRFGTSRFGQPLIGALMDHIKPFGLRLKSDLILKLTQKYCIYNIYKTMFEAKEKNFMIYVIFNNTTLDSTEYSLFQKTVLFLNKHIAGAPLKIYLVGMTKMLELSVKMLVNFLRPTLRQRIQFVDQLPHIEELIPLDEVPVHAGGRNGGFVRIPADVKSGKCLPHLSSIDTKDWDIFRDININAIAEGMRETNQTSVALFLRDCELNYQKQSQNVLKYN